MCSSSRSRSSSSSNSSNSSRSNISGSSGSSGIIVVVVLVIISLAFVYLLEKLTIVRKLYYKSKLVMIVLAILVVMVI